MTTFLSDCFVDGRDEPDGWTDVFLHTRGNDDDARRRPGYGFRNVYRTHGGGPDRCWGSQPSLYISTWECVEFFWKIIRSHVD